MRLFWTILLLKQSVFFDFSWFCSCMDDGNILSCGIHLHVVLVPPTTNRSTVDNAHRNSIDATIYCACLVLACSEFHPHFSFAYPCTKEIKNQRIVLIDLGDMLCTGIIFAVIYSSPRSHRVLQVHQPTTVRSRAISPVITRQHWRAPQPKLLPPFLCGGDP